MENYQQEISNFEKIAIFIIRISALMMVCIGLMGLPYSILLMITSKTGFESINNFGSSILWIVTGILLFGMNKFLARKIAKGL